MDVFRSREREIREEVISSGGDPLLLVRSSSPPPTPGASSAGASSPAVPTNIGSSEWLSHGQASKAGSMSCVGSHLPRTCLSICAGGSAIGSSQASCRPWERGDLLRRLATFNPSSWSGKPKVTSALACARRGWVNVDVDKLLCESCGANLSFILSAALTSVEADYAGEAFAKQLDVGHRSSCSWNGNSCTESLVQFPPTPPSALVGDFKDRCDGLFQFVTLPVIAASAINRMRVSRGPQIDRLMSQPEAFMAGCIPGLESSRDEALSVYFRAQRLISICGWEPRWMPNIQDCEEHSAQSARDGSSFAPIEERVRPLQNPGPGKSLVPALVKRDSGKNRLYVPESRSESRSPMLDCSLCGAIVRIWDFLTIPRPARLSPVNLDTPETSKKMVLTRGVSAASGISGWDAADGIDKEHIEGRDEAAIDETKSFSNVGVDLNLTMAGVLESTQIGMDPMSEQFRDAAIGRDLKIGQPSGSEIGDRAASYESRGPSTRKRSMEGGGSTVDRPQLRMQQADSVEGSVIDRDGDEVNDGGQYSAGPSKRSRDSEGFDIYHSSYIRDSSVAGPSHSFGFGIDIDVNRSDPFQQSNDQTICRPYTRESARASSVIAMDTIGHSADEDSMESVENRPGDLDDIHFPSPMHKNRDANDTSEINYSNQAQQSTCFRLAPGVAGEIGVSSTNDGEEILNTDTATAHARGGFSFGISGGSVGMGASHEAEIHGNDVSVHGADSAVGEAEPIAEVTENQGQTGEFVQHPGITDEFVPEEVDKEDPHGDSQDVMFRSVGRADSGSKIDGSAKADSVESGEKISQNVRVLDHCARPSLSCNAVVHSGNEASKEEVTQARKASLNDEFLESDYMAANGIGPPNGESNYEEAIEFDPLKHHDPFCPWVNGNVAAAGCGSSVSSYGAVAVALCGWQLTLDALDAFQSLEHVPVQTVHSESAASLYKDDHLNASQKRVPNHSMSKSLGKH